MSDAAPDQDRTPPERGGSALPSARDVSVPPSVVRAEAGRSGRNGRGRGGRRERHPSSSQSQRAKPRPARDLGRSEPTAPAEPAAETLTEIEIDGAVWTVRVLGRSGSITGGRGAPLLLVGFAPRDSDGAAREALVVGRTLETLSEAELERAFQGARMQPATDGTRGGKRG